MKKLIVVFIMLFALPAYAFELDLQAGKSSYQSHMVKTDLSVKLSVSHKGVYVAGEREGFNLLGQDMAINSISIGYKKYFDGLFVYAQGGYYKPDCDSSKFGWEGIYLEQSKEYNYPGLYIMPVSDHYRLELKPSFGAEVGMGINQQIFNNVYLNMSVSYRYLRIWADYNGYDINDAPYWIMSRNDNFDAVKIYGGLQIKF